MHVTTMQIRGFFASRIARLSRRTPRSSLTSANMRILIRAAIWRPSKYFKTHSDLHCPTWGQHHRNDPPNGADGQATGAAQTGASRVTVVTVLFNPRSPAGPNLTYPFAEDAAKKLGITLVPLAAPNPEELRELQPSQLSRTNGLIVFPDAIFSNYRETIVAVVNASRVPAIYPERDYVDSGGLMAFGPNIPDSFRRAASYVDRILRGASPGDLPIDEASKFDFVVNLRTARALGLVPTAEFLARVNELIE